jgi:hypothetical protein
MGKGLLYGKRAVIWEKGCYMGKGKQSFISADFLIFIRGAISHPFLIIGGMVVEGMVVEGMVVEG